MRIKLALIYGVLTALAGCSSSDHERVPLMGVELEINSAQWTTYGVFGYGDSRRFIRSEKVPAGFPYTASTYTGFGGILLISGTDDGFDYNSVLAYDLACPVEVPKISRVDIDPETFDAVCPKCHSRFNVCEGSGHAVSGPAYEYKYDMRKYKVSPGQLGGYMVHP